jgi:hypothetical protein
VTSQKPNEERSPHSDAALRQTLNNLAEVLLRLGINAPNAERLLREAFVRAAESYARTHGSSANQSQIATLSGVNRIDVRKILSRDNKRRSIPRSKISRLEEVLAAWRREASYLDGRGQPRPLTFRGKDSDLSRLVKRHGRDVTTKSILEQLVRTRAVVEKAGRLVITRKRSKLSTEENSARADLRFIEAQLRELRLKLGRRAYVTRRVSIQVADHKTARRLQQSMVEKIQLLLRALDAVAYHGDRSQGDSFHRVIVTANVATESGRKSNDRCE